MIDAETAWIEILERFIRCRCCKHCEATLLGTQCIGNRAPKKMRGDFFTDRVGVIDCFDFSDQRQSDEFDKAMLDYSEKYQEDEND